MGDIRSLSSDGQLGCGIPKSLSKQILRPEKNDKEALRVGLPPPEPTKQRMPTATATAAAAATNASATKPCVPDCTVSTSAASHSWHPASPGAPRPKRSEGRRPEGQASAVELDNMNRNNSSEVKMKSAAPLAVPLAAPLAAPPNKWTNVAPRPPARPHHVSKHYMTVPAGGVRVHRRHSINADSYGERCYLAPRPKSGGGGGGGLRSKRSMSMSGELPQLGGATNIQRARDKLSRSEWLLESTL